MLRNKLIFGLVSTALLLSPIAAHANEPVRLDGKMVDGRVFMPLRAAGDGIGAETTWNQKSQTATVKKDGKILQAKLGQFVKLFNNRVYIQFREFNETFFETDTIGWNPNGLVADSQHIIVDLKPLTKDEALKLVSDSISMKKERQQFLIETKDSGVRQDMIYWEGFDKFKVTYYAEWNDGKDNYYASTITVKMKKSGDKWILSSFNYHKGWMLPPH
ncbi:copper amine oxidase N-terminal domain-containing protein [Bacillus sp. FJAT-28004]|jgi:hypothetical protein|uniref:copper amine oxidase N-terminal domain-containing protein n=1 Tax=Bacillus sp. FJAT-28004 TaxID=1679165 RepID=UPI0006B6064A|nr:copper amine oxidase N-terminal domain-containing protein [Bacillus sp. FJAT-28004]